MVVVGSLSVLSAGVTVGAEALSIQDAIRTLLVESMEAGTLSVGNEQVHSAPDLLRFYEGRGFMPIWITETGLSNRTVQLVTILHASRMHGLIPDDYHYPYLISWIDGLNKQPQPSWSFEEQAGLELIMTDAFVTYGSHLVQGKVDPQKIYPQWIADRRKSDVFAVLSDFVRHGDIDSAVKQLAPAHESYWQLVEAKNTLEAIIIGGGWPTIQYEDSLRPKTRDPSVKLLRDRLAISDYVSTIPETPDEMFFDGKLEAGIKKFQEDHGLEIDGVAGQQTLKALNVGATDRLKQVMLNMERLRWLPHDLGNRHIMVNIAAFTLEAFENNSEKLSMKVIVGQSYQKTPVFSEFMTYLEINPFWNVPQKIVVEEFLPKLKTNPGYFAANKFELLSGWSDDSRRLNPYHFDWRSIHPKNFPGRVRQRPGANNALGRIKFMLPNPFHVYLHDTPTKSLFNKAKRAFSHGCIRVEQPQELAVFVLNDSAWSQQRIASMIQSGRRAVVRIKDPIPVHLLYLTAWVGDSGRLNFREDLYDRDPVLWEALNNLPHEIPSTVAQLIAD